MIKLLNHNEISFIQTSGNPHLIADLVNSTRIAAAAGKPKAKCWRGKKKSPQIHPPTHLPTQKEMQVFCHVLRDHAGKRAFGETFRYKIPILWSVTVATRKFWFWQLQYGLKEISEGKLICMILFVSAFPVNSLQNPPDAAMTLCNTSYRREAWNILAALDYFKGKKGLISRKMNKFEYSPDVIVLSCNNLC